MSRNSVRLVCIVASAAFGGGAAQAETYRCSFPGVPSIALRFEPVPNDLDKITLTVGSSRAVLVSDGGSAGTGLPGHIYVAEQNGAEMVIHMNSSKRNRDASELGMARAGGERRWVSGSCKRDGRGR